MPSISKNSGRTLFYHIRHIFSNFVSAVFFFLNFVGFDFHVAQKRLTVSNTIALQTVL